MASWCSTTRPRLKSRKAGAAGRPFRGARPLLQGISYFCRGGLVPRKGCKAAPLYEDPQKSPAHWPGFFMAGA
ncbi:hypothetical protein DMX06_00885 [Pseudomonas mosselii]|nr:hypothetical protein DMX06_00885 [Pseudomonas mosselii]